MRDHQERRSDSRGARLLLWAERLLVIAGAATLIWCAVLVSDAVIAQRSARSSLETVLLAERPLWPPALEPATALVPREPTVHTGSPIAALSIPRVQLSAVVLHGSDAQTLRRGPGHLENTAFPGESGNVVIAGHRDSFFWPLRNIQPGDDIFLDTPEGQFHYRVTLLRVVNPHDVSVLAATNEPMLTLITCYPFWVLGNAPDRFVVRAAAVLDGTPAPLASDPTPLRESIDVPLVEELVAHESAALETNAVPDDEVLVRQAVERYRLTYNARLISRHETLSDPLTFQTCEVAMTDDRATATCHSTVQPSSNVEPHGRTFMLERADGAWAIKSIVLNLIK